MAWVTGQAKGSWKEKCLKCGDGPMTQRHALVCSGISIDFNTEGSLLDECMKSIIVRKLCFGHDVRIN